MRFHPALVDGIFLPHDFTGLGKILSKQDIETKKTTKSKMIYTNVGTKRKPDLKITSEPIEVITYTNSLWPKRVEMIKYRITYYEDRYYQIRISIQYSCIKRPDLGSTWLFRQEFRQRIEKINPQKLENRARNDIVKAIEELQNEENFLVLTTGTTVGVIGKEKQLLKWIKGKKLTTAYEGKEEDDERGTY